MSAPVPPLTPYLVVANAADAIEFYKKAFGATQEGKVHRMPGTEKIMHARPLVKGSLIMISDDFSGMRNDCSKLQPRSAAPRSSPRFSSPTDKAFGHRRRSRHHRDHALCRYVLGGALRPVHGSIRPEVVGLTDLEIHDRS